MNEKGRPTNTTESAAPSEEGNTTMTKCKTATKYDDIISALEAAEEGSRELDARIAECFGFIATKHKTEYGDWWVEGENGQDVLPHYTTSIDAKLPGEDTACVINLDGHSVAIARDGDGKNHHGQGKTEALARRIASLRARSTAAGEAGDE